MKFDLQFKLKNNQKALLNHYFKPQIKKTAPNQSWNEPKKSIEYPLKICKFQTEILEA
jgi:hypothetical protein